jgi:transglutaminase-like putative cysteine protease
MMNRVRLLHVTEFEYDGPVSESYNELHLRPRDDEWQSCLSFRLSTRPAATGSAHRDYFGNWVHRFNLLGEHRHLRIEAESVVMVQEPPPPGDLTLAELDECGAVLIEDHYDFLVPSQYVPQPEALRELIADAEAESGGRAAGFARAAAKLIRTRFRYEKGATHVHSSLADVLSSGAGVCQDFTHLLLGIARARGLPARYVSGYLVPSAPTPAGETEEVSGGLASHAWAEVYVPGAGWLGLDPTQGASVSPLHVRVAYGRDYGDVPPVRGVFKGHAGQRLSVDVRVRPALDGAGCERLWEKTGNPAAEPPPESRPAQQQQQQQ